MHLIGIVLFLAQLGLIIHAVRNKADSTWLYALLFLPGIGGAAYFLTQVLPDLLASPDGGRTGSGTGDKLLHAPDPERELQRRREQLDRSGTPADRIALADECLDAGFIDEAIELYRRILADPDQHGPDLQVRLAQALFLKRAYVEVLRVLDELIEANPGFRSTDAHLLYARSLAAEGEHARAVEEYEALVQNHPGEEAYVRFATLLQSAGEQERANVLFESVLERAKQQPPSYRQREARWIEAARRRGEGVD